MSVTIKTVEMQYRGTDGQYHGINAVAEKRISDQIADIDVQLAAKEGEINTFIDNAKDQIDDAIEDGTDALNGIDNQVTTIMQAIASAAERGTDTTMTLPEYAADAEAAGDIVRVSTTDPVYATDISNKLYIYDAGDPNYEQNHPTDTYEYQVPEWNADFLPVKSVTDLFAGKIIHFNQDGTITWEPALTEEEETEP